MISVGEEIKKKLQYDMLGTLISADTQSIDEKVCFKSVFRYSSYVQFLILFCADLGVADQ